MKPNRLTVILICYAIGCWLYSYPAAVELTYSTFLGGSGWDYGLGIAIDTAGNAYITGSCQPSDFPTTSAAYDTTFNGGDADVFVSKFDMNGSVLVYSTYLGGSNYDIAWGGIAVDNFGNAYVAGQTDSSDFPTTTNAFDTTLRGIRNTFVSKLDANGSILLYSTYLGGSIFDDCEGIAVDTAWNAYIVGITGSTDFPITPDAFDTTWNGGNTDAFVSKLDATGSVLLYSTYLGGSNDDGGYGIAVDTAGNAYITGETDSLNFPTTSGAYDTTYNGFLDVFVCKLNPTGSNLIYATYFGGSTDDEGWSNIAVDQAGNAYITGYTSSLDFPTTPTAYDTTINGTTNVFISKLNATGTKLLYSTYLGGSNYDWAYGIAADNSGIVYVTGRTQSYNFPTSPDAFDSTYNYNIDVFVSQLDTIKSKLLYSTFLGGSGNEIGYDLTLDTFGNVYVIGYTTSPDFPTTLDAYDDTLNGNSDVFITKLSFKGLNMPALVNIPSVKLFKGNAQADIFQLNAYLVNTTSASWSWSSQSTFANLSIDGNSWVNYLTPLSSNAGQDTVTFTADGIGTAESILKYSTYLFSRLPLTIINNGKKILNCDIDLQNYLSKDTSIGYPSGYTYETRYANSADTGKLNISFSGSTILISPKSGLTDSAEVIVSASPGAANDWDKEIIHVSEVVDTYGEFSSSSDTSHYWYVLPVIGADGLPTFSWVSSVGGRNGVLQLNFSTAKQGVKIVCNQELDIEPGAWYGLRCAFASGAGAGNRHLVNGQLFVVDTVTGTSEVGSFLRQSGQMRDTTWWVQHAYVHNTGSTVKRMRPMLVVKNNGSSGSVFIDSLLLYKNEPLVENSYGALAKASLSNGSFDNGLNGWYYGYPAMGIDPDAPLPGYSVVSSFSGQDKVLQLNYTQVKQGLKLTSDPVVNILPLKSTRLTWKVYGVADNPNRSVSGRIYCIDTATGGVLSDVLGPSGVNVYMPTGKWVSYAAVGSLVVNGETQARVQLVVKNGNTASDTVYLDDIVLEQENDSPYYWDHALF